MRAYVEVDTECRVTGYGSAPLSPNHIELDIPEGHGFFGNPPAYQVVNGELVFVEAYQHELAATYEAQQESPSPMDELERLKLNVKELEDMVVFLTMPMF